MTAKSPGHVGDSAVIGAGTWANNETCAISATGHGEIFMRYAGQSLEEASCAEVIDMLASAGGAESIIAVDHTANVSPPFNCSGMYRGMVRGGDSLLTVIYDEPLIDFRNA